MKDNVKVKDGDGGECFVCERPTTKGAFVISVSFDIPVLVTTIKVNRDMHLECAVDLKDLLDLRIRQAENRRRGR